MYKHMYKCKCLCVDGYVCLGGLVARADVVGVVVRTWAWGPETETQRTPGAALCRPECPIKCAPPATDSGAGPWGGRPRGGSAHAHDRVCQGPAFCRSERSRRSQRLRVLHPWAGKRIGLCCGRIRRAPLPMHPPSPCPVLQFQIESGFREGVRRRWGGAACQNTCRRCTSTCRTGHVRTRGAAAGSEMRHERRALLRCALMLRARCREGGEAAGMALGAPRRAHRGVHGYGHARRHGRRSGPCPGPARGGARTCNNEQRLQPALMSLVFLSVDNQGTSHAFGYKKRPF